MTPTSPSSLTTIFLDQPPSCLQFCPATPQNFIVGTYLLSESKSEDGSSITQTKTGSLQLWTLNPVTTALTLLKRLSLPHAVFDLHFHPSNPALLAIATSAGEIRLFSVSDTDITPLWTKQVHEDAPGVSALYLAWIPMGWLRAPFRDGLAVTFADGRTGVFATTGLISEEGAEKGFREIGSFEAAQAIEVWFVAVGLYTGPGDGEVSRPYLFTGDDFGSLRARRFGEVPICQELRSEGIDKEEEEGDLTSALVQDVDDRARHHTAGVTAILPLPVLSAGGAPWLLTGSYDEMLRVYCATSVGRDRGRVVAELRLGGGVWRLQILDKVRTEDRDREKWEFLVLASCMHAGTRVVEITLDQGCGNEAEASMRVLAEFTEHESMNYASDVWKPEGWKWNADDATGEGALCVSSSFYDRRVCVWRLRE